jgi:hypothetical protein
MRDILSNLQMARGAVQTLAGVTPNKSRLFDREGFDGLSVYLDTGVIADAGTAAGFTMKLQHSDTTADADFVDYGTDTVTVTDDAADGLVAGAIRYVGNKRYVRSVTTGTTGTDGTMITFAILGKPHKAPCAPIGDSVAAT